MTIYVTAKRMRIEVPYSDRGRPSYRWTTGYVLVNPKTGNEVYPPVEYRYVKPTARELAGTNDVKVLIVDETPKT